MARFGTPQRLPATGCSVFVWELDPDGDGVIVARLSKHDLKQGETAMGQIEDGLRVYAKGGVVARAIVVAINLSGAVQYELRHDLGYVEQLIGEGHCRAVFFRDADRIARDDLATAIVQRLFRGTRTDLYLADPDGKVDWDEFGHRIMLLLKSNFAVWEREQIRKRTHGAIERQYLTSGRGLGSKIPFGFRRNDEKYLEVHPDEWPWVKRIHKEYAEVKQAGGGLAALRERLDADGCELSESTLSTVLGAPIYVLGRFNVNWKGKVYEGYVENFIDPIPPEVFERNQMLLQLSRRAGSKRTPLGVFALNGTLRCGTCGAQLEGRIQKGREDNRRVYPHRPPIADGCKGVVYERDALDVAVVEEILRLEESRLLQAEYWQRAWPEEARRGLSDELRERERELKLKLQSLNVDWRDLQTAVLRRSLASKEGEALYEPEEFRRAQDLVREMQRVERQIEVLPGLIEHRRRPHIDLTTTSPGLRDAFTSTLLGGLAAEESSLERKELRAVLRKCLSRVIVQQYGVDGERVIEMELFGPDVPSDLPPVRPIPPHRSAARILGFGPDLEHEDGRDLVARKGRGHAVQTVQQDYSYQTVRTAWQSPLIRLPGADRTQTGP